MRVSFKKIAILTAASLTIAAILAYLFNNPIIIAYYENKYDLKIRYKTVSGSGLSGKLYFKELTVTDNKSGAGLYAKLARIAIIKSSADRDQKELSFKLNGVRFLKKDAEKPISYDSMTGLAMTPFHSTWTYNDITGAIVFGKNETVVKDLKALSDDIGLNFNGTISGNDSIRSKIVIYFSGKLTDRIPGELSRVILTDEKDGWKSLSVELNGNFKSPSIQVSSKLFRLNIGVVSSADKAT